MSEKDTCTTNISNLMSKKDTCTTDVFDREKINKEVINIKKEKDGKSSTNVDNTVEPTTTSITSVTKSKKEGRIPDWLPEKDNVEIVEPIDKPPHLRSKVNLC